MVRKPGSGAGGGEGRTLVRAWEAGNSCLQAVGRMHCAQGAAKHAAALLTQSSEPAACRLTRVPVVGHAVVLGSAGGEVVEAHEGCVPLH